MLIILGYFQAGSVHVRVRRDADEQMVLAHVFNRLSNLVVVLTVQIFKDDWSRPSSIHILNSLQSGFSSASPSGNLGSNKAQSPSTEGLLSTGNPYNPVQHSSSPFSGIGLPPVLIPSRTDPAIVANFGGPPNGNIPALRLAASAPANASASQWSRIADHHGEHMQLATSTNGPPSHIAGMTSLSSDHPNSTVGLVNTSQESSSNDSQTSAIQHVSQSHNTQDSVHLEQSPASQLQKDILRKQT